MEKSECSELHAFVGTDDALRRLFATSGNLVPLNQTWSAVLLSASVRAAFGLARLPLLHGGQVLPEAVSAMARSAGDIAYLEMDSSSDPVRQAAAVWRGGQLVLGPLLTAHAVNHALRLLGVKAEDGLDEMTSLGLGRTPANEMTG